jgi:hypothetical protein
VLGFPIRKPPDQRSVANSPGHIAGSHVLHRLLMPRHPPCALKNLNTKVTRCSRSLCSSQNTNGHQPNTTTNHQTPYRKQPAEKPARYGGQTSPYAETPTHRPGEQGLQRPQGQRTTARRRCPFPQDPTVCPEPPTHPSCAPEPAEQAVLTDENEPEEPNSQCSTNEQTHPRDIRSWRRRLDPQPTPFQGQDRGQ